MTIGTVAVIGGGAWGTGCTAAPSGGMSGVCNAAAHGQPVSRPQGLRCLCSGRQAAVSQRGPRRVSSVTARA